MAYTGGDSKVESKDLFVVKKVEPEAGERYNKEGYTLRVVQWIYEKKKGGIAASVSLEKRVQFLSEDGEPLNGKAKGFNLDDMDAIKASWDKIYSVMKNPPAPAWPTKADAKAEIEEVPF